MGDGGLKEGALRMWGKWGMGCALDGRRQRLVC